MSRAGAPGQPSAAAGLPPPEFEPPVVVDGWANENGPRSPHYLRLLLVLLISAAFFEGYDSSILALLLPNIQNTFHVSEAVLGVTRIPIELGLFVAFFVTRLSDRLGRRPLLLWSVVGYTVFTALTAASWDIWSFAFFQFGSRLFLEERRRRERGEAVAQVPFLEPWKPRYRRNLVLVGLVHMLRSIPLFGSTAWWAFYAERERGFTATQVAIYIIVAYGFGCVGYYVCGRLMERIGRRPQAVLYFAGGLSFSILLFIEPAQ